MSMFSVLLCCLSHEWISLKLLTLKMYYNSMTSGRSVKLLDYIVLCVNVKLTIIVDSMEGQIIQFFKLILILVPGFCSAQHCNNSSSPRVREGNLGQSADFNWLGVLQVHVDRNKGDNLRIATSGIVLIRSKYALVNADDVARIPVNLFKTNAWAMFLPSRNTPLLIRPASYVTHPEYENSNLNTIAIIELDLDKVKDFPLTPVCLPTANAFNVSRYLYLTGFTDENNNLEKIIYKIQFLDGKVCEEFYNRTGVLSQKRIPSTYHCGYAPNSVGQCVWENGMALVSNAKGYLNLIGFGVHGPGCAAPARFIDLFPYLDWINSMTSRAKENHRRKESYIESIPIHELYTTSGSRRQSVLGHEFEAYPFDVDTLKFHIIEPTMDENTISITYFHDTFEQYHNACSLPKAELMYREEFQVNAYPGVQGNALYKLSLYDLAYEKCICVFLTVDCVTRSDAVLSFKEKINFKENVRLMDYSGETPEEVFRYFPLSKSTEKPNTKPGYDMERTQVAFINDNDVLEKEVLNCDLYIQFKFNERATLKFQMLARKRVIVTTTTTTTTTDTPSITTTLSGRRVKTRIKARPKSIWGIVN